MYQSEFFLSIQLISSKDGTESILKNTQVDKIFIQITYPLNLANRLIQPHKLNLVQKITFREAQRGKKSTI